MTRRDEGFSMAELVVVMSLMGVLMGFAVSGWAGWSKAHAHEGAALHVQSVLRSAQQRAVTEGRALCVVFDAPGDRWQVESGRCDSATRTLIDGPWRVEDSRLDLDAPRFEAADGSLVPSVTFTSRGTASRGTVDVRRSGSSKVYVVSVEGLTGRVSVR